MSIFIGITYWVGAGRLSIATSTASSDTVITVPVKKALSLKQFNKAMFIIGEGLILLYVCYTEHTASPTAVQLSTICEQIDPAIR